jgi:hypothetical protein
MELNIVRTSMNDWTTEFEMEEYIRKMEKPFRKKHSALIVALSVVGMVILFLAYNSMH